MLRWQLRCRAASQAQPRKVCGPTCWSRSTPPATVCGSGAAAEHLDVEKHIVTPQRPARRVESRQHPLPHTRRPRAVSFRNISTVGIVDKASGEIVWQLGYETLAQQTRPQYAAQRQRADLRQWLPSSRRWPALFEGYRGESGEQRNCVEYRDNPAYNFFSAYISGARRLPNGNTLITEGQFGRMFQVTPEGEVVWEYINPHFHIEDIERTRLVNRVFRATHYLKEEIPWLS